MLQDNQQAGPSREGLNQNIFEEQNTLVENESDTLTDKVTENPHSLEKKFCVIHINTKITPNETKTFKLFTDETVRKCKFLLEVPKRLSLKHNFLDIPNVPDQINGYHSSCYRIFTAVKTADIEKFNSLPDLEVLPEPTVENTSNEDLDHNILTRQKVNLPLKSSTTGIFKNVCIFCNNFFLYYKRKKYGLIPVRTINVQNSIMSSVKVLDDTKMRLKVDNIDFIAKEVKYHQVCRVFYQNKAKRRQRKNKKIKMTLWKQEREAHKKCLDILKEFITSEIIEKGKVFYFFNIRDYYLKNFQDILNNGKCFYF